MSDRRFEPSKQGVWCQACRQEARCTGTVDDGPFIFRISCECGAFFQFTVPEGKKLADKDEIWEDFKNKVHAKFVPAARYLGKSLEEIQADEGAHLRKATAAALAVEGIGKDLTEVFQKAGIPAVVMVDGSPEAEAAKKNPNMRIMKLSDFMQGVMDRHEKGECGCEEHHDPLLDEEPKGRA